MFRFISTGLFGLSAVAAAGSLAVAAKPESSIDVTTEIGQRLLHAGKTQRVFVRVAIRGRPQDRDEPRTPSNIALTIDRSGSMGGQKIMRAREAASMAINRLNASDYAAVVAFDDTINTLVPSTQVKHHSRFHDRIDQLRPGGSTAIYSALEEAARQIKEHQSKRRLNRIILISDGKANVGPSDPDSFAELGQRLGARGISVSTIGLGDGYNEDLMAELATASDGNHAFARSAADLTHILNQEFDDLLSVTGQDVEIIIRTRAGVVPIRTLGRPGKITGNEVRITLNQVYGTSEYSLQLELEVPAGQDGTELTLADVEVVYTSADGQRQREKSTAQGRFSASDREVQASINPKVMEPILELEARERSRKAVKLRDKGKIEDAKVLLRRNATELEEGQKRYNFKSERLEKLRANNEAAAASIADRAQWNTSRKQMREDQSNRQGSFRKY